MLLKKFQFYTILKAAIKAQEIDMVKHLLKQGTDPDYIPLFGPSIIGTAIEFGTPEILKELLKKSSDPNVKLHSNQYSKITPLFMAITLNKDEMVKVLLQDKRCQIFTENYVTLFWGSFDIGGAGIIKAPGAYQYAIEHGNPKIIDTFKHIRAIEIKNHFKKKKASNPKPSFKIIK